MVSSRVLIIIIDLFWIEKLICFLDFMQIFALYWCSSNPYPLPYLWIGWTRWSIIANVDFFSLSKNGALLGQTGNISFVSAWGEMRGYLYYALYFALGEFAILLGVGIALKATVVYGKHSGHLQSVMVAVVLILAYLFYLPVSLAFGRLFYCDSGSLAADPSVSCFDWSYLTIALTCLLIHGPVFALLPWCVHRIARDLCVYSSPCDHEKRLQSWELTFLLGVDEDWLDAQVYVISSFTLGGAYFRRDILLLKAWLLLVFLFVRSSLPLQAVLIWISALWMLVQYGISHPPFRCTSSNAVWFTLSAMLLVNASFMAANAFGVENSIMVASTETIWLLSLNSIGVVIVAIVFVLALLRPVPRWPCLRTLRRLQDDPYLAPKVARWVSCMRDAHQVRSRFLLSSLGNGCSSNISSEQHLAWAVTADVDGLERAVREVRRCWAAANAHLSVFSTPLAELLEELLVLHSILVRPADGHFSRRANCWNQTLVELEQRRNELGQGMGINETGGFFARRQQEYTLVNPRKRRVLTKLLAVRAFRGGMETKGAGCDTNSTGRSPGRLSSFFALGEESEDEDGPLNSPLKAQNVSDDDVESGRIENEAFLRRGVADTVNLLSIFFLKGKVAGHDV